MSIQNILTKGGGPYGQSIRARVCASANPVSYTGPDDSSKQALTVAICDRETSIRLVCYDPSKFPRLKIDNVVMLREVIVKTDEHPTYLVGTRATKVFLAGGIDVNDDQRKACETIVHPPAAPVVTIAAALGSPVKQRNSVKGKIIQEEQVRTILTRAGNNVQLKKIVVHDGTAQAQVSLWRENTQVDCHTDDYIEITYVTVNFYQNQASLSTTGTTTIKKCEAPLVTDNVTVEAVSVDGSDAELLLTNNNILKVSAELLGTAVGDNIPLEELTVKGPVELSITMKGSDVLHISTKAE